MKRYAPTWFLLLAALLVTAITGCASIVGDDCTNDSDCGSGLVCDASLPDGYCTRTDCEDEGCPDEGLCVTFDVETSYCMKPCADGSDCRSGYECVTGFGPHPFCAIPESDGEVGG